MKAKVVRRFRDKITKAIHKAGDVIEVNKKRFAEINATRFGILVEELDEKAAPTSGENTPDGAAKKE